MFWQKNVSAYGCLYCWLLWELMSIKCYKMWPGISDNKCTAAIAIFREVLRDKMCTSPGGWLITPLVRNSYRWKYVHVWTVWLLTPSATHWASLVDEINVPAMLLVCVCVCVYQQTCDSRRTRRVILHVQRRRSYSIPLTGKDISDICRRTQRFRRLPSSPD